MKKPRVLFFLPYPLHQAPSQRFRIEAFFPYLQQQQIIYDYQVFLNEKAWKVLYSRGAYLLKAWAVFMGFIKRIWACLFLVWRYDYIVVHREAAPLGPPVFEWLVARVLRRKMIFDFDDAIWIPNVSEGNKLASLVKCFWKIKWICKWSYKVSAGNDFLANYARKYNSKVFVIPTSVDMSSRYVGMSDHEKQPVTLGWTGSHSTVKYLEEVFPVLKKLEEEYDFRFRVICNKRPSFDLKSMEYIEWNEEREIEELKEIQAGIMPLVSDPWSEGKCGFKLIQYLSLGIPSVATPVGVNKSIIENGINGYLVRNQQEWYSALQSLMKNSSLRKEMGIKGKAKMQEYYSVEVNAPSFAGLFT